MGCSRAPLLRSTPPAPLAVYVLLGLGRGIDTIQRLPSGDMRPRIMPAVASLPGAAMVRLAQLRELSALGHANDDQPRAELSDAEVESACTGDQGDGHARTE
jgi:hypothetical protein